MERIGRIFLSLLGIAYLVNFWVLHDQALLLFGKEGLLPIAQDLPLIKSKLDVSAYWRFPTLFWFNASDKVLQLGTWVGLALSLLLTFRLFPKVILPLLWGLFLSYVTVGRTFYSFQWDILMLEATLLALFLPSRKGINPHKITIVLFWLLAFKLHFESGIAKVWVGKQGGWLDFSAMQYYYDTAPLPTWLGWIAHQMPTKFHQFESLMTLIIEIGVPLLIFFGRRCRIVAFLILIHLQVVISLTANYGIFNFMSVAVLLFLLKDSDLKWIGVKITSLEKLKPQKLGIFSKGVALFLVLLSALSFTQFLDPTLAKRVDKFHLLQYTGPFRSVNTYHLFASITRTRLVAEIEGTDDGINWKPYRFRYYPGDLYQRPDFVAPYHPRLDFRLWFLTLSQRSEDWVYFTRLLGKIFHSPKSVSAYFAENPFPQKPPTALRFKIYQYNMSSMKQRRETGAYWIRQEKSRSKIFYKENFKP